jgi:hypothetical protein
MVFYFAWLDAGDTTFGVEHQVEDEQIYSFKLEHQEGDFCSLTIEIKNPRVGLLNEARPEWCWFSYRKLDDTVVPLFHGRLVGIPADMTTTVVSLDFIARPDDYEAQKSALAETLKVAPYWDPIWIAEEELTNPDVVLNARPQLYHIGRTDRLVTVSNILIGEAGTLALGEADIVAGTISLNYGEAIAKVSVEATVEWAQYAKGIVDMSGKVVEFFGLAGAPPGRVASYTGQGLESTWPRYNDGIGGGWVVDQSRSNLRNTSVKSSSFYKVDIDPTKATPDFTIEDWWASSPEGYDFWYGKAYDAWLAQVMLLPITEGHFYLWEFTPTFMVRYEATRNRKEVVTFDVLADLQPMLYDPDAAAKVTNVKLNSTSVGNPIDPGGGIPIGDVKRRSYFDSDRAAQSIDYMLNVARSKMLYAARAVEVSLQLASFELGLDLSCRHDAVIATDDLPGGTAGGKIIGYSFELNGDDGQLTTSLTFGAVIGLGNTLDPPDDGVPSYVTDGYVSVGYQQYIGKSLQPIPGELEYTKPTIVPNDDGLDFDQLTSASILADTAATALLTFTGTGAAGNDVGIGAATYPLVSALTGVNDVLIGADADETARNLTAAINGDETQVGVTFGAGTIANGDVSATTQEGIVRITARLAGPGANSIALSKTGSDMSWDAATMHDGDHGLAVINGPTEQRAALNHTFGSVQEAIDALNAHFTDVEMALKPVTGGPFETDIALTVSKLMVSKTIDLAAAAI